ncbi:MAG: acyl-CoA thioester hydrolase/BAAT C-terminal domain-containing protein [Oscillospiraceae bacterium]|nr:acyl-CoA thioester hydrolase/BAAT C-terminal domain-containing protein [Oscillospiraceae bacterium]MDD4368715.1 acyl-CoA thioester hydrolase/BAAT C-terminal domain-containing protein [Oscillospiraceae bacterium]
MKKPILHPPGLDACLYPAANNRHDKAIITLSGSEGGLQHATKMARFRQGQGLPALALGYFKTAHTVPELKNVPLETVGQAIDWLHRQGYQHIAVEGLSKGAEYALACAIAFPDISCVIAKAPTWYYGEGLSGEQPDGCASWSWDGQPLPFTSYQLRRVPVVKYWLQAGEFQVLSANTGLQVRPESVIPVEKIHGPLLLLGTSADTVWPSAQSGEKLRQRLDAQAFAYPYQLKIYQRMSHIMLENANGFTRLIFKSERHYPAACAEERKDMARLTRHWLETVWQP